VARKPLKPMDECVVCRRPMIPQTKPMWVLLEDGFGPAHSTCAYYAPRRRGILACRQARWGEPYPSEEVAEFTAVLARAAGRLDLYARLVVRECYFRAGSLEECRRVPEAGENLEWVEESGLADPGEVWRRLEEAVEEEVEG